LDRQLESKGQCFILLVGRDSAKAITETGYRVFIRFAEVTFKVLGNPDEDTRQGKLIPAALVSPDAGVKEGTVTETPITCSEIPVTAVL
jgi:hypothetical protein